MGNGGDGEKVTVLIADEVPIPVLADEALKMLDDCVARLMAVSTERERFWLCMAVSACEQLAFALLSVGGEVFARYRTPSQVSYDYFGRYVNSL